MIGKVISANGQSIIEGCSVTVNLRNLVVENHQSKKELYLSPTVGGQTYDTKMANENSIY